MIPSITPPTDNLYKFLSLFGLTIFLFSIYNLGFVYDQSSISKIKVEDVKIDVQKRLYERFKSIDEGLENNPNKGRFRPLKIRQLGQDLEKIQNVVSRTIFKPMDKIELNGKLSKLKVEIDTLRLKLWVYIGITLSGIVVMVFGFFRWLKREQNWRDRILIIEHTLKESEKNRINVGATSQVMN